MQSWNVGKQASRAPQACYYQYCCEFGTYCDSARGRYVSRSEAIMRIFEMATRLAADCSHEAGTEVEEKEQHMRAFGDRPL